jgi:hypothetical protein
MVEPGIPVVWDGRPAYQWVALCSDCGFEEDRFRRKPVPQMLPCMLCGGMHVEYFGQRVRQGELFANIEENLPREY